VPPALSSPGCARSGAPVAPASWSSPIFSSGESVHRRVLVCFSSPNAMLEFRSLIFLAAFLRSQTGFILRPIRSSRFGPELRSATGFRFCCRSLREFLFLLISVLVPWSKLFSPPGSKNRRRLISLACFFWVARQDSFPAVVHGQLPPDLALHIDVPPRKIFIFSIYAFFCPC
jgi:hypothetical protein